METAIVHWVPPYFDPLDPLDLARVVDPTGAGNAFMGGVCAALDQKHDLHEGVSASCFHQIE